MVGTFVRKVLKESAPDNIDKLHETHSTYAALKIPLYKVLKNLAVNSFRIQY